ncbi:DUF397 domain-containing protein [Actinopolyspora mortivallis]|uniref:DUF397 domain-containing protein n=1 Tax=Actinopolyspora mortivallis TaxID=33906 RepID=A0A2T0GRI6_ACTMO|nr:DUF397 domain-containing protein [Actinopolyspora mortivallis]PRW61663.1 DUF397 domain-containing protein [Actinopolyspora mortivallis]
MTPDSLTDAVWRKSSRSSGNGGACVEVGFTPETIGVRDTKDREGGTLVFSDTQWEAFLDTVKRRY